MLLQIAQDVHEIWQSLTLKPECVALIKVQTESLFEFEIDPELEAYLIQQQKEYRDWLFDRGFYLYLAYTGRVSSMKFLKQLGGLIWEFLNEPILSSDEPFFSPGGWII